MGPMTTPTTALIVIDVQEEYFSGALQIEHPDRDASLARIGEAMDAATRNGDAVVVVRQNGPGELFATGSPTWALRPEVLEPSARPARRQGAARRASPAPSSRRGSPPGTSAT